VYGKGINWHKFGALRAKLLGAEALRGAAWVCGKGVWIPPGGVGSYFIGQEFNAEALRSIVTGEALRDRLTGGFIGQANAKRRAYEF
jgi:hypothetical protein